MKSYITMRTVVEFMLALPRNRCGRVSTTSRFVGCFSFADTVRVQNYPNLSPVRRSWYGTKTSSRRDSALGQYDNEDATNGAESKNWLVVGDGDLSYSATIAGDLAKKNIRLFATVLEEEKVHDSVYDRSSQNKEAILSCSSIESQHEVQFGVDATRLKEFFPSTKFKTIEFNFPHWRGKTNAKRNRALLDSFMGSAAEVLDKEGEIVISLCEGQGGFPASTAEQWKQSWLVPKYAAENGLLLRKLNVYEPLYQQTSHRGVDRPWVKDGSAQRYTFTFPNEVCIDKELQISCRHELRVVLPKTFPENSRVSRHDIIHGDAVFHLTEDFVPEGIRMQVVAREILDPYFFDGEDVTLAIFLLNYSGEKMPLTRDAADAIRSKVEESVQQQWGFNIAKGGRLVSLPYPTHLLPSLIRESSERNSRLANPRAKVDSKTI